MKTPRPHYRRYALAVAGVLAMTGAHAGQAGSPPENYPGSYSSGGVDSVQQLVLLDDHTFCYALMAGALDLLAGGHWQSADNPTDGIVLQEVKAQHPAFPVLVEAATSAGQVSFDFHGHSLSMAEHAVFAVAETDTPPKTLRPLFVEDKHGWSPSYMLPAMSAAKARYFFLGYLTPVMDHDDESQTSLSVAVYALEGDGGNVRVGFDPAQAMAPLRLQARLEDDVLSVHGESFGQREPLTPELATAVRNDCITPALSTDAPTPNASSGNRQLLPLRTFSMPASAVRGAVWFPEGQQE